MTDLLLLKKLLVAVRKLALDMGTALRIRGVKPGGTVGQIPVKLSDSDYEWQWSDPALVQNKGDKGDPGNAALLRISGSNLEYSSDEGATWSVLYDMTLLVGADGVSVELQLDGTNLQWRVEGGTWATLLDTSTLVGADGASVSLRLNGAVVEWQRDGDGPTWIPLLDTSTLVGADGASVELQVDGTNLQWRPSTGGAWTTIYDLNLLAGAPGDQVELRVDGGYVEWKYVSAINWTQLVALSEITGPPGTSVTVDPVRTTFTGDGVGTTFGPVDGTSGLTNPAALIVAIDGVLQEPGVDYEIGNPTYTYLTFTVAPPNGSKIVAISSTNIFQISVGTPSDGTVTSPKLATNIAVAGTLGVGGMLTASSLTAGISSFTGKVTMTAQGSLSSLVGNNAMTLALCNARDSFYNQEFKRTIISSWVSGVVHTAYGTLGNISYSSSFLSLLTNGATTSCGVLWSGNNAFPTIMESVVGTPGATDFSIPMRMGIRATCVVIGLSTCIIRFGFAKAHNTPAPTVGAISTKGFGVELRSNGSNAFAIWGFAHNGVSLTTYNTGTTYNPTLRYNVVEASSDGAGNVTVWLNGQSIGSFAGGPTGASTSNNSPFLEQDVQGISSTFRNLFSHVGYAITN